MNPAPNFALPDQSGTVRKLSDFAGKWLILYFYPQDDTAGCTTEACEFRDDYATLQAKGLQVVGISKDSVDSHAKFAEKYHLNFPILSDEPHAVIEAYDAWNPKKIFGSEFLGTVRTTLLINPDGNIAKRYDNVTPKGHSAQIMADFEALTA